MLVIGATGQLGRALCAALSHSGEVLLAARQPLSGYQLIDLSDTAAAVERVNALRPDWVLIAGAYCNVDGAENHAVLCRRINADTPAALAAASRRAGYRLVYFSTDSVFDGTQAAYQEDDHPHPVNVYAASKADGEQAVRAAGPERHLILRTAWLYGADPTRRNFVLRLIDQIRAGESVRVPEDQWGSPTHADDLAAAVAALLSCEAFGTFHATGPEMISRAELARQACEIFGLNARHVVSMPTAALAQQARRPLRVRLVCERLAEVAPICWRGVRAGLQAVAQWDEAAQVSLR